MINFKRLICLFILIILNAKLYASEPLKPLQIFIPYGFKGKTIGLDLNLKRTPALSWRIPSLINTFKKEPYNTIVFSAGDISSIYEPISFLFEGKIERELINECEPCSISVSPNDIAVFNASKPDRNISNTVFTNAEGIDRENPFTNYKKINIDNKNIYFFNFISPSLCENLPFNKWTNITINTFTRAFRRINSPLTNDKDITITTVYGSKDEVDEIVSLFKKRDGTHLVIQVLNNNSETDYPYTEPVRNSNVYIFSLDNGLDKLPMIRLAFKTSGLPRVTLRMLPLNKSTSGNSDILFEKADEQIKNEIFKPLRIITTNKKASTSSNYIPKSSHARMLRKSTKCDIAIITDIDQKYFNDNVINIGNIMTVINNDRIYKLRLKGNELKQTLVELINEFGINSISIDGCSFKYFADKLSEIKISGMYLDRKSVYILALNENSINHSETLKNLCKKIQPEFEGLFILNLWKNWLKTGKIPNDELFE